MSIPLISAFLALLLVVSIRCVLGQSLRIAQVQGLRILIEVMRSRAIEKRNTLVKDNCVSCA